VLSVPSSAVTTVPGPLQIVNCPAVSAPVRTRNGRLPCRISMRAVSLLAAAMADISNKTAAMLAILMFLPRRGCLVSMRLIVYP